MKASDPSVADVSRQGAFSRAMHSIRSRYSLSTAVFLLFLLALFYAGGRVVLVHLVRDAENQVKEIGSDLSWLVYKDAEMARRRMEASLSEMTSTSARHAPRELLSPHGRPSDLSIAVSLSADGKPGKGVCRDAKGEVLDVSPGQLAVYGETLSAWCRSLSAGRGGESRPIGLMRVAGRQHYVTVRRAGDSFLVAGVPFSTEDFGRSMGGSRAGMSIRVTHRQVDVTQRARQQRGPAGARNGFGFAPLFSEAANFYTSGF